MARRTSTFEKSRWRQKRSDGKRSKVEESSKLLLGKVAVSEQSHA